MSEKDLSKAIPGIRRKTGEEWTFFDESHLISNYGRWYSIKCQRIMKQFRNTSGYYRVKINKKQYFTHIKVVELFGDINKKNLDNIPSLFELGLSIDHLDKNKKNNSVFNLEIVTHQENCIRRSRLSVA